MKPDSRPLLMLLVVVALFALASGASGCDSEEQAKGNVEGEPVDLGPVVISVVSSRYLERKDEKDAAHLTGQFAAGPGLRWFGVFLELQNRDNRKRPGPALTLTDATGRIYSAFPTDAPNTLEFGEQVPPGGTLPRPDRTEQGESIEGELVIFRLGAAAKKHRPLTLHLGTYRGRPVTIELDF